MFLLIPSVPPAVQAGISPFFIPLLFWNSQHPKIDFKLQQNIFYWSTCSQSGCCFYFFYVGGSRLCQHFHDPFTSFKSWELCYQTSTPRFLVMGDTTSSGFYPYNNSLRNVDYNQGNGEVEASQNSFLISSQNGCLSPKRLLPSTLSI